jgi:hypothetical protein
VTASGGTGTLTYTWSTTPAQTTAAATGLAPGIYTITVKDANNCAKVIKDTVVGHPPISTTTGTLSVRCFGESNGKASVAAMGGSGSFTYIWSTTPAQTNDTAMALSANSYVVTVSDALNCTASATVTVSQPVVLTVAIANGGTSLTANPAGGTPNYVYHWSDNSNGHSLLNPTPGNYTVTVTDSRGCMVTTTFTLLSIETVAVGVANFDVYPNPSAGLLSAAVKMDQPSDITLSVIDITGRKVFETSDKAAKELIKAIDLSMVDKGAYIITLKTERGTINRRILLE